METLINKGKSGLGSSPRGGADNLNQRVFVPIAIGTSPRGGADKS